MRWAARLKTSTDYAAAEYCRKEETRVDGPWEHGERPEEPTPGKRSDLIVVAEAIQAGNSVDMVSRDYPVQFIKFHGGIERLISLQPRAKPKPYVTWVWGPSGTGKSETAQLGTSREAALKHGFTSLVVIPPPKGEVGCTSPNPRVFEEYKVDQTRFVFEDYTPKLVPHCDLKRYLDVYPVTVTALFRGIKFVPEEIIITCSYPPSHYWTGNPLKEIERRCHRIIRSTEKWPPAGLVKTCLMLLNSQ